MIARLIELSLRNKVLVVLVTIALVAAGLASLSSLGLDAIPDLSDVQVIVTADWPGQNPEVIDEQVTYPLSTALLAVPGASAVRGLSMPGEAFVAVIFADGTDGDWARSRVLELLGATRSRLPAGVEPRLGPDATGVGWVFQYALVTGWSSPDHPHGLWHDAQQNAWYARAEDAPLERRVELVHVRAFESEGNDPLSGRALVHCELDLAALRTLQDTYLRYPLSAVGDVAEVASLGGFVKQYQVALDPAKLEAYGLEPMAVAKAIERSNGDVSGSVLEIAERELMVRSKGYLRGLDDLATIPLARGQDGRVVQLRDVAALAIGGDARRGIGELDGRGECVGAIVVARSGANAAAVIAAVKHRLTELEDGLPAGVLVRTTYDRSLLIGRSVDTLRRALIEEIAVVGLVCIFFLLHLRSELVAVFVVPASVLMSLLAMRLLGLNANIMSLGGIAISIGVLVDSAIVMVENAHKHLDREEERIHAGQTARPRSEVIREAAVEVGPQLFFSLLVILTSFLPVFVLTGEAGKLFKPLAMTKSFAMGAAALFSVTIVPIMMQALITDRLLPRKWSVARSVFAAASLALVFAALAFEFANLSPAATPWRGWIALGAGVLGLMLFLPQKLIHENKNPLSRILQRLYEPVFRAAMARPRLVIVLALGALASAWWPASQLPSEFMPPLDEGDLLYMPTVDAGVSATKARELLQTTDALIASFPEVASVHGKVGRANTATDPAPLSMIETVVQLKPDHSQWRWRTLDRFWSGWPDWLAWPFAHSFWPGARSITTEELVFGWQAADGTEQRGLNAAVALPGVANSWPFPIENRLQMLATGIKTAVGVKFLGPDLAELGPLAERAAAALHDLPGTASAYAERTEGGTYLDLDVDRERAAHAGLTVGDVQDFVRTAIGGETVTTTVEGLARVPVTIRYLRELRDDPAALEALKVPVPASGASAGESVGASAGMNAANKGMAWIPLGDIARISIRPGAPMIRSENAQRTAWVFVDVQGRDVPGYVAEARAKLARELTLPAGTTMVFAGQFEAWEKTRTRVIWAACLALGVIVVLLYLSSRSWFRVTLVLLAVPFSLVGALWFLHLCGYSMSMAVVIGLLALAGLDAETGMVMLLYLDTSTERFAREGKLHTQADLWKAVHEGAVLRIRPKAMTVAAAFIGLVPLLWAQGSGADTMRRIAAPLIGGLLVSFAMELVVMPVAYFLVRRWRLERAAR